MCSESRGQGGAQGCYSKEECPLPEKHDPEKRSHCFVLWHTNATGAWTIKLKVSYDLCNLIYISIICYFNFRDAF